MNASAETKPWNLCTWRGRQPHMGIEVLQGECSRPHVPRIPAPQGLRILDHGCDAEIDGPDMPLALWESLEAEVTGGLLRALLVSCLSGFPVPFPCFVTTSLQESFSAVCAMLEKDIDGGLPCAVPQAAVLYFPVHSRISWLTVTYIIC